MLKFYGAFVNSDVFKARNTYHLIYRLALSSGLKQKHIQVWLIRDFPYALITGLKWAELWWETLLSHTSEGQSHSATESAVLHQLD